MSNKDFWEGYVPEPVKPAPPPECQTEAEKTAYAFGWWKALESQRALDKKAENARELGLDYEPVCNKDPQGCWNVRCQLGKKCKNTPAQRTWVGLSDDEIYSVLENLQVMHHRPPTTDSRVIFARAIEAKLRSKNEDRN
jgi:hypothetical protein